MVLGGSKCCGVVWRIGWRGRKMVVKEVVSGFVEDLWSVENKMGRKIARIVLLGLGRCSVG